MQKGTEIHISDLFKFKKVITTQPVKARSCTVKAYLITNQHPMAGNLRSKAWLLWEMAFLQVERKLHHLTPPLQPSKEAHFVGQ